MRESMKTPTETSHLSELSDDRPVEATDATEVDAEARRVPFRATERLTGMLMGCAIGDALGMPVEGIENADTLRALHRLGGIRDFLAPQAHVLRTLKKLRPGCWTDDTQLTLAMARSIIAVGRPDYDAIAAAYVRTFETLELRGWDPTTKQACRRLQQGTSRLRSGKTGGSGNAVATRISPVAAWSFMRGETPDELLRHCVQIGVISHCDPRAIVGAFLIGLLVREALGSSRRWEPTPDLYAELVEHAERAEGMLAATIGVSDDPISQHLTELSDALDTDSVELAEFANGATSYACYSIPYVIALLCGRAWEFEDGIIAAVNGGGDTDSNTAMVGAVLGAAHGSKRLPRRFVEKLEEVELLREVGAAFARACEG